MTKSLAAIFLLVLLLAWQADAQQAKTKPAAKPTVKPTSRPLPEFPGYEFIVEVAADKTFRVRVITGYESAQLDQASLKKALDEYMSMQSPKLGQIPVGARVIVHVAPTLDLKTIIQFLKTAREGASELSLQIAEDLVLRIPPEPKPGSELEVKPNPLTLVAGLDDKGAITLNNELHGSLADLSKIRLILKDIFSEREANGVFRENTNEVQKTVSMRVPPTARFSDLAALAKAMYDAGAEPLWLQIDDLEATKKRLEMVELEALPKPVTKSKRRP